MYQCVCKNCGAPMMARVKGEIRMYCSKKCYDEMLGRNHMEEIDIPLGNRNVHPDGYSALVCAIVQRAKNDVLKFKPGTPLREDAERFFLSDYFQKITGMDGEPILKRLIAEYNRKHRKKGAQEDVC